MKSVNKDKKKTFKRIKSNIFALDFLVYELQLHRELFRRSLFGAKIRHKTYSAVSVRFVWCMKIFLPRPAFDSAFFAVFVLV